jgi:uncharacterized protein (DUF111 family)
LSVIKENSAGDIGKRYGAGVKAGNGTLEDWRVLETVVDSLDDSDLTLQREQLKLSIDSRIVIANDGGYNVHLQQPEIVAQDSIGAEDAMAGAMGRVGSGRR